MHPLAVVTRYGKIENIHHGLIYVTDPQNHACLSIGESDTKVYLRSAAKPFLAISFVHSGAMDRFGITEQELAVICSSHTGQRFHIDAVNSILMKAGLSEDDLLCGSADPDNRDVANRLIKKGRRPSPLHNCCSGKHAGILAMCKYFGYPVKNYTDPDHPVRRILSETVAELAKSEPREVVSGKDNCGLPAVIAPVRTAAYLYSLLASAPNGSSKYGAALGRIRSAMKAHPRMINGDREFGTELGVYSGGKVIGKVGSDGIYCAAVPEKELGICIKIGDGSERAAYPVLVRLLYRLGVLNEAETERLKRWAVPVVKGDRGQIAGVVVPVFDDHQKTYHIGEEIEEQSWIHWQS